MPRIISGEFRSRRLIGPGDDESTRPYLDRVKESVFNMLREWCDDASVLDLFAGVGTVGLETVSRGARSVLMVEQNKRIHQLLQQNIDMLGCGDRATAMLGDALGPTCLARVERPVDLVFIDPPYAMMSDPATRELVMRQIEACRAVMTDGYVVLRVPFDADEPGLTVPGFEGPEPHQYRPDMWVHFYHAIPPEAGDA